MDEITRGIIGMKQAQLTSQIQFSVARKVLDNQELQGNAAVKLIEAAGKTASQAGDALVAAATGLGGSVDTYA
jgi:hypothetical protein